MVSIYLNDEVNMRQGIYHFIPLFWANAILAIILLMNISIRLDAKYANNILINFLKYVGKYSIVFLCLNQLVIRCWFKVLHRITPLLPGVINIIISGMSLLTLTVVAYFCETNTRIAKLFGLVK